MSYDLTIQVKDGYTAFVYEVLDADVDLAKEVFASLAKGTDGEEYTYDEKVRMGVINVLSKQVSKYQKRKVVSSAEIKSINIT
jgi:hypothetical protein